MGKRAKKSSAKASVAITSPPIEVEMDDPPPVQEAAIDPPVPPVEEPTVNPQPLIPEPPVSVPLIAQPSSVEDYTNLPGFDRVENGDHYYVVERVLEEQLLMGQKWFKVKWLGWDDPTWVNECDMEGAQEVIKDFRKKNPKKAEIPNKGRITKKAKKAEIPKKGRITKKAKK